MFGHIFLNWKKTVDISYATGYLIANTPKSLLEIIDRVQILPDITIVLLTLGPPPQEHEQLSYSSTRTKAPSVIISGLKPATWYIFCVRTRTPAGYSSYSPKYEYKTTGDCKFLLLSL